MAVPLLRPGQTHAAVPKLKRALIRELVALGLRPVAAVIRPDSKTYGSATVNGVKKFQQEKRLDVDGIVGEDTWRALGIKEPVADVRPVLHGVPFEEGLVAVDENWVDAVLAKEILAQRKAGQWRGKILSGYRPAWYQKRLFDAAVIKYGSEAEARKWVAPPGKSRHGKKGGQGAVDVTPGSTGADLDRASERLFRPMEWEPWHVQVQVRAAEMPEGVDEEPDLQEPTAAFEESGITADDADETIAVYLEKLETGDAEPVAEAAPAQAD